MNTAWERIFNTIVDTNKIYMSMKDKFSIRVYKRAYEKSPISLHLTGDYKRESVSLNINVNPKEWDLKRKG